MTDLKSRLLDRIEAHGPIPFEDFMEAALYDPEAGFFAAGPVRSTEEGDFLTSPEVSSEFGTTLGRFCAAERARVGEPFTVVDVGAGTGSLLASLLAAVGPIPAFAVEASAAARASLGEVVGGAAVLGSLGELPGPISGVIVANELVDNLPAPIAVRGADGWDERWVGRSGSDLVLVTRPARSAVAAWCARFAGEVGPDAVVEAQIAATHWVQTALSTLARGALLIVDYGGTAEELAPRRRTGTLRTYRSHHLGPDPLLAPGETDITADVNFTALIAAATDAGADVDLMRQDDFLSDWGLRAELRALRQAELDAARRQDTATQLELRARRVDAETLLHPRGLGDFRVLVARK